MSCYGWERGSVKLPVKEWTYVRNYLFATYNEKLSQSYDLALKVYDQVKEEKKGKRGFDVRERCRIIITETLKDGSYYYSNWGTVDLILCSLINNKGRLIKPKKKDFKSASPSKGGTLNDECLSLRFDNKFKTIEYYTDDNNHSMDVARESTLGKAFFNVMKRVSFTNKTGGFLREYNEYMQCEGEGARVTDTWGKYTKRKYYKQVAGW